MDFGSLGVVIVGILYVGLTIYLANVQDATEQRGGVLRWLLFGTAAFMLLVGLMVLFVAIGGGRVSPNADITINLRDAALFFIVTVLAGSYSLLVVASPPTRLLLRRIVPGDATFNPVSNVHMTAIVLCLFLIVMTLAGLILGGGLTGMAETIATSGIAPGELLFQGLMWIVISLLGTGLAIRRTHQQVIERLGLRLPTRRDVGIGVLAGLILFGVEIIAAALWTAITPADQLAAQTVAAQQIGLAINTLPLALIVSITSAVGEEIFFRGAIQPVFGIVLTSLFFAVIHTQYALTPATALIFVIALVLGWLRQRYSTSTSIIAHFVYNFVPLTLAILFGASLGGV